LKLTRTKLAAIVVVVLIVAGLAAWTFESPPMLPVQSQRQLGGTIFSASRVFQSANVSDGSGSYKFKFGMDYDTNITRGQATRLAVYCALTSQQLSSPFARGVTLSLQSATLIVDNSPDESINVATGRQPGLLLYYLENPDTNIALGLHNITARLVFYTVDDNYIGNSQGSLLIIQLNGTMTISS